MLQGDLLQGVFTSIETGCVDSAQLAAPCGPEEGVPVEEDLTACAQVPGNMLLGCLLPGLDEKKPLRIPEDQQPFVDEKDLQGRGESGDPPGIPLFYELERRLPREGEDGEKPLALDVGESQCRSLWVCPDDVFWRFSPEEGEEGAIPHLQGRERGNRYLLGVVLLEVKGEEPLLTEKKEAE